MNKNNNLNNYDEDEELKWMFKKLDESYNGEFMKYIETKAWERIPIDKKVVINEKNYKRFLTITKLLLDNIVHELDIVKLNAISVNCFHSIEWTTPCFDLRDRQREVFSMITSQCDVFKLDTLKDGYTKIEFLILNVYEEA